MLSKIFFLLKMTRPTNILMAVLTLLAGYCLMGVYPPILQLVVESLAFVAVIAFGNIHNDILDTETDAINCPDRALPSKKISFPLANSFAALCFTAPLFLSFGVLNSTLHATFFAVLLLALFAYNRWLKNIPLVKNMTIAFLCTTPLLLTTLMPGAKPLIVYPALLFAFFFTFSRELLKDIEDESGDFKAGIPTFPVLVGATRASVVSNISLIFSLHTLFLPVLIGIYHPSFLIFAGIPVTALTIIAILKTRNKQYKTSQKLIKLAMLVGIVGLIVSQRF